MNIQDIIENGDSNVDKQSLEGVKNSLLGNSDRLSPKLNEMKRLDQQTDYAHLGARPKTKNDQKNTCKKLV